MVEQGFGWDKTVGGLRKLRHRGTERVGWVFTFTVAVYDLVRLRTLGSWPECLHERLRGREVPTLGHESAIRTAGKVLPHVGSPSPTAGTHSRYYFFSSLLGRAVYRGGGMPVCHAPGIATPDEHVRDHALDARPDPCRVDGDLVESRDHQDVLVIEPCGL